MRFHEMYNVSQMDEIGILVLTFYYSFAYLMTLDLPDTAAHPEEGAAGPFPPPLNCECSTLIAQGGASEAPPRQMLLRRFMTFFFEVLRIFWHEICENQTSRYVVTWLFVTRCQPEKWDFVHFVYKVQNKWQSEFFIFSCKSVIVSSFGFVYH